MPTAITPFGREIVAPNIQLHGGPKTLLEDLRKAAEAIEEARRLLRQCMPHPRDYAELGECEKATEEHLLRHQRMYDAQTDLETLQGHLILGGVS
jgi:hypothetical protein